MKKLTLLLVFIPVICFSQNKKDTVNKLKYQYIQINLTAEQFDTINYVLSKTIAEFPTAVSAIKLFQTKATIQSVYDVKSDTNITADSTYIKPKNKRIKSNKIK